MNDLATRIFGQLMALGPISEIPIKEHIQNTGMLIDLAGDLMRDDGTARALEWCDELDKGKLTNPQKALLEYFKANAWDNRQRARHTDEEAAWQWVQPEMQRQVFHLRKAAQSSGFEKLPKLRRCQILTNLANQLNTIGRFVDALSVWSRVISIDPNFGMALGNRACGLIAYAQRLYDPGHEGVLPNRLPQGCKGGTGFTSRNDGAASGLNSLNGTVPPFNKPLRGNHVQCVVINPQGPHRGAANALNLLPLSAT